MTRAVSQPTLFQLSELVAARTGLHFPRERWLDLERGISSAAKDFGFADALACADWLLSSRLSKREVEMLASYITVGETYFFREQKSFEALEHTVLPELLRTRRESARRLRIWSAGCCTGEEPYSIAILLVKLMPDSSDWTVSILGTDINPRFLEKASEGLYNEWSFRDTPPGVKDRYFLKKKPGHFEILPSIKEMVTFSYLNLAEDVYPSLLNNTNAMDLIFCRNVLMYFAPERAKKVIDNLHRCLVDGGWLVVSPSETSHVLYSQFETVNLPHVILYRKAEGVDKGSGISVQALPGLESPVLDFMPPASDLESLTADSRFPTHDLVPETPESPDGLEEEQEVTAPPHDPYEQAVALHDQGRYAEAAERLSVFLSENQSDPGAMALLARVYANQGRLAQAAEWCEKAITADKLNPACHYLLATILHEQDNIQEAMASLKRALYLDEKFILAHFLLGNINLQRGKPADSKRHFRNALLLLQDRNAHEILPASDGITAGRLIEIIRCTACPEQPV